MKMCENARKMGVFMGTFVILNMIGLHFCEKICKVL